MFSYLRAANFDPQIIFEPIKNTETPDLTGLAGRVIDKDFEVIFFQKIHGNSVLTEVRALRAAGIKTVFGVCDVVDQDMVEATDATVIVTEHLKGLHPPALQSRISVVHDGIERPEVHKCFWSEHRGSPRQPLRAVLVTSVELDRLPVLVNPPAWLHVTIVGRYPGRDSKRQRWRESRWQFMRQKGWREKWRFLQFLTHPRIRRLAWDAEGVYAEMLQADLGIIPIEMDPAAGAIGRWQVKSENRLTLKMCVGLPVIATPIPAYLPVVQDGKNAFLATDRTQWLKALSALRDPALRRSMGQHARETALHNYSMERQAEKLVAVFRSLVGSA